MVVIEDEGDRDGEFIAGTEGGFGRIDAIVECLAS
jgi:hypothetical protein